jgi:hypothetical protein
LSSLSTTHLNGLGCVLLQVDHDSILLRLSKRLKPKSKTTKEPAKDCSSDLRASPPTKEPSKDCSDIRASPPQEEGERLDHEAERRLALKLAENHGLPPPGDQLIKLAAELNVSEALIRGWFEREVCMMKSFYGGSSRLPRMLDAPDDQHLLAMTDDEKVHGQNEPILELRGRQSQWSRSADGRRWIKTEVEWLICGNDL